MSRQSNSYIIIFSAILTLVVGGSLAGVSSALKDTQKAAEKLDNRKQILSAVMELSSEDDVLAIYEQRIRSLVVDSLGNIVETDPVTGDPVTAETVNVEKNYKRRSGTERLLPVYVFMKEDGETPDAIILPVYGNGLWDNIWGYVALETDYNTVRGAVFAHKGETPGLGARITTEEVQQRFQGKEIYNESGELVSVSMVKGENNEGLTDHQVDGMSGATITGTGVNKMMENYLKYYQAYIEKQKQESSSVAMVE